MSLLYLEKEYIDIWYKLPTHVNNLLYMSIKDYYNYLENEGRDRGSSKNVILLIPRCGISLLYVDDSFNTTWFG